MNNLDEFFINIKGKKVFLLEIGITNESIKIWNKYFMDLNLYGFDNDVKATDYVNYDNIELFIGNKAKRGDLKTLTDEIGNYLDVIVDNSTSIDGHKLTAFAVFFRSLKPGGFYIIKNTQFNPHTIETFKNLIKNKSFETYWLTENEQLYTIKNVQSCIVYPKTIIIRKNQYKGLV